MIARAFINQIIPPLGPLETCEYAISIMELLNIDALPVVDEGAFLGILKKDTIEGLNNKTIPVSHLTLVGKRSVVGENQHFYDILRISDDQSSDLIAVQDHQCRYLGVVALNDTIKAFTRSFSVQNIGSILTLSMPMIDYSLEEIARLVEAENVKILSSWLSVDEQNKHLIHVTLKFNVQDISRVVAVLERFGYNIISEYRESMSQKKAKENLDLLMKFIEI